jgi:tRNA-modifying protein YgfZ
MSLLISRDTLAVEGRDAAKYLQGQLSNDVLKLDAGGSCWSFLLEPSGKLGFLLRVLRVTDDSFVLDMERGLAAQVEARLRRFLIRTKVTLVAGVESFDVEGTSSGVEVVGWWGEGRHVIQPLSPTGEATAADIDPHYEGLRIAAGWPGAAELTEGIIPGETGLVAVTASFTKGCYTGQELVARIDSRGNNVPHHLCKIALDGPAAVGDVVVVGGESKGTITSIAGLHALAYIHRSIEAPAAATVAGSAAAVRPQR